MKSLESITWPSRWLPGITRSEPNKHRGRTKASQTSEADTRIEQVVALSCRVARGRGMRYAQDHSTVSATIPLPLSPTRLPRGFLG